MSLTRWIPARCAASYMVMWGALFIPVAYFYLEIFHGVDSTFDLVVKAAIDTIAILSPFWLLPMRWRRTALIPVWAVAVFLFVNILYYRFFGDMMQFRVMGFTGNVNGVLIGSALALIHPTDTIYLICPIAATVYTFTLGRNDRTSLPWPARAATFGLSILIFLTGQAFMVRGVMNYHRSTYPETKFFDAMKATYSNPPYWIAQQSTTLRTNGLPVYTMRNLISLFGRQDGHIVLSDPQHAEIDTFLRTMDKLRQAPDPAFIANHGKNLILIIVESLNSSVIGQSVGGEEVTPFLNSLIADSTTVSCLSVQTRVADGTSSDGHLMYNTGLLPLIHGSAAMQFDTNTYPSLAAELPGHHGIELLGNLGSSWNHFRMSKLYGYKEIHDKHAIAPGDNHDWIADSILLDYSADRLSSTPQPFLAQICTISMHFPFTGTQMPAVAAFDQTESISGTFRAYVTATHYTDACLRTFADSLRSSGLYDNSIIVIASDHSCPAADTPAAFGADNAVFIALNTGKGTRIRSIVGQEDIYPTILEIMGVEHPRWPGVGLSILNPAVESKPDGRQVSDLMIRGDYFSHE